MNLITKCLQNFALCIIAIVLGVILIPIGLIFAFLKLFLTADLKGLIKGLSQLFRSIAISLDQLGNTCCAYLFNLTLIKDDTIAPFGDVDETISSVLGRNKLVNNLTICGKVLDKILDLFDKNHSIKSIGG